jgi:hypothetical protein
MQEQVAEAKKTAEKAERDRQRKSLSLLMFCP